MQVFYFGVNGATEVEHRLNTRFASSKVVDPMFLQIALVILFSVLSSPVFATESCQKLFSVQSLWESPHVTSILSGVLEHPRFIAQVETLRESGAGFLSTKEAELTEKPDGQFQLILTAQYNVVLANRLSTLPLGKLIVRGQLELNGIQLTLIKTLNMENKEVWWKLPPGPGKGLRADRDLFFGPQLTRHYFSAALKSDVLQKHLKGRKPQSIEARVYEKHGRGFVHFFLPDELILAGNHGDYTLQIMGAFENPGHTAHEKK